MTIEICIGSSCYVKGSDKVVLIVKDLLVKRQLDTKVELKGSFCMNACEHGIGVKLNGKMIRILDLDQAEEQLNRALDEALL
jgi:NADH:ubiquinone oxidoreductase subunit E